MERLFTIGVYGFDEEGFFTTLREAKIDLFLDIRRRRGLRGGLYPFANAMRLQKKLAEEGIAYRHVIDLAPDGETRALQAQEDAVDHVARRKRERLGEAFVESFKERTLEPFDWQPLVADLDQVRRPVLFCVERVPEACHRGLVAGQLAELTGIPVTHLVP
ncbi:MAG TPA: DUF488 family protein [Chloroflexota bacterium]|nr:DUF488 family protein [Chloroflexota bacterium]